MNNLPHWVIWHIPHANTAIPAEFRDQFLLNDAELQVEAELVADTAADRLYLRDGDTAVVFPWSRLVVDPERLFGDAEPMEAHGLGVTYRRTHDGRPLRRELLSTEEKSLVDLYTDHHARLSNLVEAALEQHGRCLIIDGHSYPAEPLPFEDTLLDRPPVCLGTDPIHTPNWLVQAFVEAFNDYRIETGLNTPYSGTLVPKEFQCDARVMSLMIETRKNCYDGKIREAVEQALASAIRHGLIYEGNSLDSGGPPGRRLSDVPKIWRSGLWRPFSYPVPS